MRQNDTLNLPYFPDLRLGLLALGFIMVMLLTALGMMVTRPQAEVKLAKGTEGLIKQTAMHLSKLNGGVSVGGFPGFEPPDDDEAYRQKIKNSSYSNEELNHWVREINNFLRQIADKNPNMTLEQILRQAGLTAQEIESFIRNLQAVYKTTETLAELGLINPVTAEVLKEVLMVLGVPLTW